MNLHKSFFAQTSLRLRYSVILNEKTVEEEGNIALPPSAVVNRSFSAHNLLSLLLPFHDNAEKQM